MQRAYILPSASAPRREEPARSGSLAIALLAAGAALACAALVPVPELWVIAALAVGILIVVEPRLGLYLAAVAVGLESVTFGAPDSPFRYLFLAIGSSTPLSGLAISPVELLVLWTTIAWAVRSAAQGSWRLPNRYLMAGAVCSFVLFLLAVQYGVSRGADLTLALWEVRPMLAVLPLMLITTGLVTERRHLAELGAVLFCSLLVMAGEQFWEYLFHVRGAYGGALDLAFTHENGPLIALVMVIAASWALWGPNPRQRLIALAIAVLTGIVLLTMRRRAGLVAGEAGLLLVGLVLLVKDRRRFMIIAPIAAAAAVVYLGVYWNDPNTLGQPARAFRSVFDTESLGARDQASDDYRFKETQNVWWNIQAQPTRGLGFGMEYPKPQPMPDLTNFWPFWPQIPHNTILWVWLKAGVFAFVAFWFLVGAACSQAAAVIKSSRDPLIITAASAVLAYIVMLLMFSYVDLGLLNPRLMMLFGMFLGLVPVLQHFAAADSLSLPTTEEAAA
ncbi:MAG: O-antigen ligase family protein [Dehalococcoidia bacterium]